MSEEPDPGTTEFLGDPDEFLDAVAVVMRTFDADGIRWRSAASADGLKAAGILATPKPYMARAGLMTTAAVIRWAATETGKSEDEILAELRRSLATQRRRSGKRRGSLDGTRDEPPRQPERRRDEHNHPARDGRLAAANA